MKDLVLYESEEQVKFTDLRKISKKDTLVIVQGGEHNRIIAEKKHVDILVDAENIPLKDHMHFRRSGLDQVICPLLKKNNIALAFNFNTVLHSKNRSQLLGRMMQNVKLCRKYKVNMILASFAKNRWEKKGKPELEAFGKIIGMTTKEAKNATNQIGKILSLKKKTLSKGITKA